MEITHRPLISILIPVYNTEPYLKDCLDSVIGQTYPNLQIVILDDGSTDGCAEICREYANKDSRIEFFSVEHGGVSVSRNRLIKLTKGQYSLFIDSDDWIKSDTIEILVNVLEKQKLDILMFRPINEGVRLSKEVEIFSREQAIEAFLQKGKILSSLWTKLVKTELYKSIRFDENIGCYEDVLMTWELINASSVTVLISNRLYYYRDTPNSLINCDFNDYKFSIRLAWSQILKDCEERYQKWVPFARKQLAKSYVWMLYTAIRSNYKKDDKIMQLQREMRKLLNVILSDPDNTIKYKSFSIAVSYLYSFVRILVTPWRKRLKVLR